MRIDGLRVIVSPSFHANCREVLPGCEGLRGSPTLGQTPIIITRLNNRVTLEPSARLPDGFAVLMKGEEVVGVLELEPPAGRLMTAEEIAEKLGPVLGSEP